MWILDAVEQDEQALPGLQAQQVLKFDCGLGSHERGDALMLAVHSRGVSMERRVPAAATASHLNRILMLLRSSTGHDFSFYKRNTIVRRIERRMAAHDVADTEIYARYLKEHPEEVRLCSRNC